jgi:hypothetical protein
LQLDQSSRATLSPIVLFDFQKSGIQDTSNQEKGAVNMHSLFNHEFINRLLFVFLLTIVIALMVIGFFPKLFSNLNAQQIKQEKRISKGKELIPIPLAPEEDNPQKRAARESKNRQYNYVHGEDLNEQREGEVYGRVTEGPGFAAIPVSDSELIIIGRIAKAQPYLSENRTTIYSEFSVSIEDVFKNETGKLIGPGSFVTADREGGAILMPDGRALRYIVNGIGGLPKQGGKYVLFIKKKSLNDDFTIITGYKVQTDGITPLEELNDRLPYTSMTESEFINEVKRAILNSTDRKMTAQ